MSRSVSSDSVSGSHAAVEDVDIEEGQHQTPTNHVQSKSDLPSSFIATREKSRLVARSVIARTHDHHSHMNQPVGPLPTSSDAPTSISEACSSTNSDDGWRWGKKSWVIIRRHPIPTVLAPLLLLAVLVGLGVYGVIAASNTYTSNLQASANALVNNAARSFGDQINLVWSPQDTLAKIIQANPNLDYWRNNFKNISDGLLDYAEDKAADGVLVMLQIQPHGISRMFANPYLPGLLDGACTDLLTSPGNPQQAAFMMSVIVKGAAGGAAVFNGPLSTTDAATGQVYPISAWLLNPVFIHNVSKDEDFGYSYSDSPAATQCVESGPCYNATTRSKWWGYTTSFFSFGPLITGNQSILSGIPEHGFSYKLTAPAAYTSQPMIVGQVGQVVDEGSVRCEFNIPYKRDNVVTANPWVLSIYPNNGWDPTWKTPLIVAVVVISIVVSLLVSVTIVGLYRQRDLLKESQDTNGKLLTLAHSLEEEKKSTYALVARQLALIECLGREAAEAQGQFHKKTHGDGDDLMMGKGSSSLVIDPEIKALSVHQIDLIRKDLIDRTSKRMSRASVALLDQGSEIPDLEILHIVGEGSFGKVFKCLWRGSPVALKTLVLPSNMSRQEKREKMAVMEAAISSSLSHPNICSTYTYSISEMKDTASKQEPVGGAIASPDSRLHLGYEVQLVLEYCDLGCLRTFLDSRGFYEDDLPTTDGSRRPCLYSILITARDISSAMTHMHDCNIMHLDLKARNIMLKSDGTDRRGFIAKVADFGLASKLPDEGSAAHESGMFQGTLSHMAPEMMTEGRASKASDVYAFGILLWELYTGDRPWKGINNAHLAWEVTMGKRRPEFPAEAPREFVDLAVHCWADKASERPTFEQVHRSILGMIRLVEDALRSRQRPVS